MKKGKTLFLLGILCILCACSDDKGAVYAYVDESIAYAPYFTVYLHEIMQEYQLYLQLENLDAQNDAEICRQLKQDIADYLLKERIRLHEAAQRGLDTLTAADEAEIAVRVEEMQQIWLNRLKNRLKSPEASDEMLQEKAEAMLSDMLTNASLTQNDLYLWQKNAYIVERLNTALQSAVTLSKEEADILLLERIAAAREQFLAEPERYFDSEEHMRYYVPESTRLYHILRIPFPEQRRQQILNLRLNHQTENADTMAEYAAAETRAEAEAVFARLSSGAVFTDLMKEEPESAHILDDYPNGQPLTPQTDKYSLFSLAEIGAYTGLQYDDDGYYIVQYAGDMPQVDIDALAQQIDAELLEAQKSTVLTTHDSLWAQKYPYIINQDLLDAVNG